MKKEFKKRILSSIILIPIALFFIIKGSLFLLFFLGIFFYATSYEWFKMNKDGALLMNFLSIPMTTPLRQKIGLFMCAERGTTMGGNPKTRKEAFQFARQFMGDYLLSND